ncbi:MAG: protein-disulfide reductase DsbD family protein [Rhodobacterales bacterium]|nr:protein-disulfide reductase DsbD family protein [Rhodobacterales bacterium]
MTKLGTLSALKQLRVFVLLLMVAVSLPVAAISATSERATSTAVTARLITAENGVAPKASSISAGLEVELSEGWKTYWRSPGEVGIPPSIDWEGSTNIADVEFLWPAPKRFRAFGIENFGYQGTVVFPLRIVLKNPGEPAHLSAAVNFLICSNVCIPQDFVLTLDLPQDTGIDAKSAGLISKFAEKVPTIGGAGKGTMTISTATISADLTTLTVTAHNPDGFQKPDIFPEFGYETAFGAPDIRLGDGGKFMWARLPILSLADTPPDLAITITDGPTAVSFAPEMTAIAPEPPFALEQIVPGMSKLVWITLMAALGGLILNFMPCVLPVLSIKLSSALKSRDQSQARIRGGFLMTALGVVAFMWALAGATLLARQLGLSVGWGLQFQNTSFLVVMILILTVFAANTFGMFEMNLPQSWQDKLSRADGAAHSKGSYSGDFFTGAFAAVLATPCSAPFLGTAIAFALSGRPIDIFVIFTALGIGLALPYLLIAAAPGLIGKLPKPGRWMLWFKFLLGGLLALTVIWLFWVLAGVGGTKAMMAVAIVVGIGFVLLSRHLFPPARWKNIVLVALVFLSFLAPQVWAPDAAATAKVATDWQAFDRGKIAKLVSEGEVVFVDVTADWCLTCKANKTLVLNREPVASALAADGITPMQADWTRPDESISRYLASFGRYGIPFNVVYGPSAPEGIALPEILTAALVTDALKAAAQQAVTLDN